MCVCVSLQVLGVSKMGFRKEVPFLFCLLYVGERKGEKMKKLEKITFKKYQTNSVFGW